LNASLAYEAARDAASDSGGGSDDCSARLCACGSVTVAASFSGALVKLALFAYSSVVKTTFVLLHCVPVSGLPGDTFIFQAATVRCYQNWQLPLFALLAVLVLVPAAWLLVIALRSVTAGEASAAADNSAGDGQQGSGSNAVQRVLESPYRAPLRFWQAVLLLQMAAYHALEVFINHGQARTLALAGLALCALVLHLLARPFRDAAVNAVQTMLLAALAGVAILGVPQVRVCLCLGASNSM
jgi:hypothetical protein